MPYKVVELFGKHTDSKANWNQIVTEQSCPFDSKRCFKVRKSDSSTSIGTCTVRVGSEQLPLIICPKRLLEANQVFADCIHLLTRHEPGNELHLIPEISIAGGSVDFFLVSARKSEPVDFVGIEFQTLDTTGTVWPARQEFLRAKGLDAQVAAQDANKTYGVNWKMTAKTILMQLHHKVETFEVLGRNFVLVIQTPFMDYMESEFSFDHLRNPASIGDVMHFHSYDALESGSKLELSLASRKSTTSDGIAKALNQSERTSVQEKEVLATIRSKMSPATRWSPLR